MPDVATANCTTGEITTRPLTAVEITRQQTDAALAASQQASADAFHGQIVALAQSAVGTTLANLTPAQIKALAAVLLYKAGGVDPATLQVLPLSQWA